MKYRASLYVLVSDKRGKGSSPRSLTLAAPLYMLVSRQRGGGSSPQTPPPPATPLIAQEPTKNLIYLQFIYSIYNDWLVGNSFPCNMSRYKFSDNTCKPNSTGQGKLAPLPQVNFSSFYGWIWGGGGGGVTGVATPPPPQTISTTITHSLIAP